MEENFRRVVIILNLILSVILILLLIFFFVILYLQNYAPEKLERFQKLDEAYAISLELGSKVFYSYDEKFYNEYTKPIFEGCNDDLCKVRKLYINLSSFDYEIGADLNPKDLIKDQSADCDEFTILTLTLLRSAGINGKAICTYDHCYTKIENIEGRLIIFDVAQDRYLEK